MTKYTHHLIYQEKKVLEDVAVFFHEDVMSEQGDCGCQSLSDITTTFSIFLKKNKVKRAGPQYDRLVGDKISLYFGASSDGNPGFCYWFRDCCSGCSCYSELYMITDVPKIVAYTDQERSANEKKATEILLGLQAELLAMSHRTNPTYHLCSDCHANGVCIGGLNNGEGCILSTKPA